MKLERKYPDGETLSVAANAIAVAVAKQLNLSEQNILGNLLTLVGASLLAIAAVNEASSQTDSETPPAKSANAAGEGPGNREVLPG